jgi:hypothetical protein
VGGFVESRPGEFVAASADPVDGDVFGIAAIAPNVGTRKDSVADGEAGRRPRRRHLILPPPTHVLHLTGFGVG